MRRMARTAYRGAGKRWWPYRAPREGHRRRRRWLWRILAVLLLAACLARLLVKLDGVR